MIMVANSIDGKSSLWIREIPFRILSDLRQTIVYDNVSLLLVVSHMHMKKEVMHLIYDGFPHTLLGLRYLEISSK